MKTDTRTGQRRRAALDALVIDRSDTFAFADIRVSGEQVGLVHDLDGVGELTETFTFHGHDLEAVQDRPDVRAALELLHLTTGVSYLKALLPPKIETPAWPLDEQRGELLGALLTHGLAEFAYFNEIELWDWFELPSPSPAPAPADLTTELQNGPLVPIGGGKDSVATLEALRDLEPTLFGINARGPIERTFEVAEMPVERVTRQLDKQLFALNEKGALNGHVPVTAIVSAAAVVTAVLGGHDTVAFSNEASADQPTIVVDGHEVNHQWSKSTAFEAAFARIVQEQVHPDLTYCSFLRPASELSIARRFATLTAHHGSFNSCNRAFHLQGQTREWCGECPKCRFVYLVLAPFLTPDQLVAIFGQDLLADPGSIDGFAVLAAIGGHKPFECVGEVEESAAALACLATRPEWKDHAVVRALAPQVAMEGCDELKRRAASASPDGLPDHLREAFRAGV